VIALLDDRADIDVERYRTHVVELGVRR